MSASTEQNGIDGLSKVSKVVQTANKQRLNKTASLGMLLVIALVIGGIYFFSTSRFHRPKNVTIANTTTGNPYILQENLQALLRMQEEMNKKIPQNVTPSSEKISNPMTVRQETLPLRPVPHQTQELLIRMNAPTTFFNAGRAKKAPQNKEAATRIASKAVLPAATVMMAGFDANSSFLNAKNTIEQVEAQALSHPDYTLAAGEFIPAVLETAIQSDLPGMVRALTSRDVYAITGERKLIPKGSRLIGQYSSSNIGTTQTNILISWTRVQLPNGIVASLNSPSTDALGRAGQGADAIDRHFLERFSTALLFSLLGAATASVGVSPGDEYNSASAYRMAVANSLQKTARESLKNNLSIQSTLHIHQGTKINVFVARDISFFTVNQK